MKTNTLVVGGITVLLVIGGLIFYTSQNMTPSNTASSTSTTSTGGTPPAEAQVPGAPTAATNAAVFAYDTAAVLTGTVSPNGPFTQYWFEYGTTANMGIKTSIQLVGSGYTVITTPAFIPGLTKNTTYYFRLVAQNQYGTTYGSEESFQTTVGNPPPAGSAPTTKSLAASGISRSGADLNGEVTPNKAITQFWFEYGKTPDLGNASTLQSVGDGTVKIPTSLSLSNLLPATTYYFRLNAQNQFGTINGSILNFKTAGPPVSVVPVVTTQVASPVATTTATLLGTVNPYGTQTTYWFEYSTDSALGSALVKTTPKKSAGAGTNTVSIEAKVSALKSGTTYYYRTVAQNSAGTVHGKNESFKTK